MGAQVVDTEVHVFSRVWPVEAESGHSMVEHFTWHEHSGDLLIAEMDRTGVDIGFLIAYDGYDFKQYMVRFGSTPDQFYGGRTYTFHFAKKYPERFRYFATLRDPRVPDAIGELADEAATGLVGIKIFPNYLELPLDHQSMDAVFRLCTDLDLRVIVGLEDTDSDRTYSHEQYWEQTERSLRKYPSLRIQFNHGGAVHLPSPEADAFFQLVRRHENVFVSTSYLGGPLLSWADEWRYPFPEYLRQLEVLYKGIGPEQMMWASDWPWLEQWTKYPQLIDAVRDHADFMSAEGLRGFLGDNAQRFLHA